jgi:hypothetical protein
MLESGAPNPGPQEEERVDSPSAPLVDAVMKRILERKGFGGSGKISARSPSPAPAPAPVAVPVPVAAPAPVPAPVPVPVPVAVSTAPTPPLPRSAGEGVGALAEDEVTDAPGPAAEPARAAHSSVAELEVPPEDLEATDTPSHVPVQVLLPAPGDLVPTIERCNRCRVPVESNAYARQRGLCSDCLAVLPTFEPIKPPETAGLTPVPPPARVSTRRRANAASSHGSRSLPRGSSTNTVLIFIVVGLAVAAIVVFMASRAQAP